jgi:DNA-binding NarL/FixJ family response regulator
MSIKLLLADPHVVALRGWRQFLAGSDIEIVAETSDSSKVLELIQQFSPEAAMIAIEMHGQSGLTLLAEIKQRRPQLPVLLTACQDHAAQRAEAYKAQAAAFVVKSCGRKEIQALIHRAAAGDQLWTRDDLRRITGVMTTPRLAAEIDAPLTLREAEVLRQVTQGATNRQIADNLGISYETVKEHIQHVLEKVGVGDRTQAALWAVRRGLV